MIELKAAAVLYKLSASLSQAAAAASIESDPEPEYVRAELISGGNAPKSIRLASESIALALFITADYPVSGSCRESRSESLSDLVSTVITWPD
jgi:hypothetical protein